MALSDEILASKAVLASLRAKLSTLATECGASGAFLVDEKGTPFAARGNVEFRLPHPLATFGAGGEGDLVLEALVGEASPGGAAEGARCVVERVSARALLVLVFPAAIGESERLLVREKVPELAAWLQSIVDSMGRTP